MTDRHKLADGVEVTARLYLTSDAEGIDTVSEATYRGGMRRLEDLPQGWQEAADHLGIDVAPLLLLASDWRFMTRDEVMACKAEHEA